MNVRKLQKPSLLLCLLLTAALLFAACATGAPEGEEEAQQGKTGEGIFYEGDLSPEEIPDYAGEPYVDINGGEAEFTREEMAYTDAYESYSDLDDLGRCGTAEACLGEELMPTEERERISEVKPTGWQRSEYSFIEGELLYNRCHLIAYSLTAENANAENLITGTRYMNAEGMEPFESMTASYVRRTGNHVMYRVTPIFEGSNLIASGVHMMAKSVEDEGAGIDFNVYCFNVQPGVLIDYASGDNRLDDATREGREEAKAQEERNAQVGDYVLNNGSMKFHLPDCPGVKDISEHNRRDYRGTRGQLLTEGYEPCGSCRP